MAFVIDKLFFNPMTSHKGKVTMSYYLVNRLAATSYRYALMSGNIGSRLIVSNVRPKVLDDFFLTLLPQACEER